MADNVTGVLLDFSTLPASEREPFNGAAVLDRVSQLIGKYVHATGEQARIITCWAAHTHAVSTATVTPYLNINSATKQAGKTRLLEVLELLVARPWLTGRVTAACLVRKIDQIRPTLLLDESDAAFNGDKEYAEALRGVLNTGFYAGGVASCCVGQGANITFKDFRTYCAKAIAGIGNLPDTVADRSIPIRLQRKKAGESVARFRRRHAKAETASIKNELSDWMESIADSLKDAEPELPTCLTDRQQDGLEPLLAIADVAGGEWPEAVRQAAIEIFSSQAGNDQNIAVQLLSDIRNIFDSLNDDKLSSADLVANLAKIETSPWSEWKNGKPITPTQLARQLKHFQIGPKTIRTGEETPKGYDVDCFADAWERYLPKVSPAPPQTDFRNATPPQVNIHAGLSHFSRRNTNPHVAFRKSEESSISMRVVADVADQNSPRGGGDAKEGVFPQAEGLCSSPEIPLVPSKGNGGGTGEQVEEKTMPSCPACGSFAVDARTTPLTCWSCEARQAELV